MNIQSIQNLINDNQLFVEEIPLIERPFSFEEHANYVFVGLRQAGKSYLMFQRIKDLLKQGHSIEEIIYINFDDERLSEMKAEELDLILQAYRMMYDHHPILFLDEVQNVVHWENFARRLANEKYRVYITGSNAKMLSSEVATTLGGRYLIQEVYPYSFREFLTANQVKLNKNWMLNSRKRNEVIRLFDTYFHFGGLPESISIVGKRPWLTSLYQKIFFGDLVTRYGIRNDNGLKLLIKKLAESVKQPSSYSRLANVISSAGSKIQQNSVVEYIKYSQETWLIFSVQNYAAKFAEKEAFQKYYFRDNGILNLFLFDPDTSLLENLVAISLKRQFGDELYFYNKNVEVDFFVPAEKMAIQVSYSLTDDSTYKRETDALLKFAKFTELTQFMIITYNEERTTEQGGVVIEIIPIWKWLLM